MKISHVGIKISIILLVGIILCTHLVYWRSVTTLTRHMGAIVKISEHLESGEAFHSAVHSMMMEASDQFKTEEYIKNRDVADEKLDHLTTYLDLTPVSKSEKALIENTEKMAKAYSIFRDYAEKIKSQQNVGFHMAGKIHIQKLFDEIFNAYKQLHTHHCKEKEEILSQTQSIKKSIRTMIVVQLLIAIMVCILVILYFDKVVFNLFDFMENLALHDKLTNLYNRHGLDRIITRIDNSGHKNRKDGFGVMLLDIDHFKMFNDNYGHTVGDQVLKKIAKLLLNSVRKRDYIVRYGGEEFLIIMPGADIRGTKKLAEIICRKISESPVDLSEGTDPKKVTVSIGFAATSVDSGSFDDLVKFSDDRLYKAKNNGRNTAVGPM